MRMRKNKFSAKKTVVDGRTFDSQKEAARYTELKLLEKAGKITDLQLQVSFMLMTNGKALRVRSDRYPNGRKVKYVADFVYFDEILKESVIEDVKGFKTRDYKLKRAIMENMGYEISEV